MAILHLSVKCISRAAGRSATAVAAYRAGVEITDARTGLVHNDTRKRGIVHAEILAPDQAPTWAHDCSALWNAAEAAGSRKNSTVAQEFEVALPVKLDADERKRLTLALAQKIAERHRCAVDVAIHEPGRGGDDRSDPAYLHCATRRLSRGGRTERTRELDALGQIDGLKDALARLRKFGGRCVLGF